MMVLMQEISKLLLGLDAKIATVMPGEWQAYWSGMNGLTKGFLACQAALFAVAVGWYLGRMFLRRIHLPLAARRLRRFARRPTDERNEARDEAMRRMFRIWGLGRWAQGPFRDFVHAWKQARPSREDRATVTVRLRQFLTPEVVIHRAANQRACEALPGIFLAVGIFGTFLGLVVGLMDLNLGGAVNQMEDGVRRLVEGLSLAFLTSLIGILSSVLFSVLHKHGLQALEMSVRRLDEAAAELFPCESEELTVRKYLEDQTEIRRQLQTLATDIGAQVAKSVAPAMENAVGQHLAPVLEDMRSMLKGFTDRASEAQNEAIRSMLGEYVELLQGTFRQQLEDVSKLITETSQAQSEIREELVRFGEYLQRQFAQQTELIEKTGQAGQVLNESLDGLRGVSGELAGSAGQVSDAAGNLADSAKLAREGQEELRTTLEEQVGAMARTRVELTESWSSITAGTESVVNHLGGLLDRMAEDLGEHLLAALASFDGKLGEVIERFSGTLYDSRQAVEELPGLLATLSGNTDSVATQLETLESTVKSLETVTRNIVAPTVERVAETTDELAGVADRIGQTAETLGGWPDRLAEKLEVHLEGVRAFETSVDEAVAAREAKQEKWFESLGFSIENLATKIESGGGDGGPERPREGVDIVVGEIRELGQRVEGLREMTRRIVEAFERLPGSLSEVVKGPNGSDGQIIKTLAERLSGVHEQIRSTSDRLHGAVAEIGGHTGRIASLLDDAKGTGAGRDDGRRGLFGVFRR